MSKNDKIESVIGELDQLSADLSVMLSRVAALRQTVEFMRRETDNVQEVPDIIEMPVAAEPDSAAEMLAEDVMTEGEIAVAEEPAYDIPVDESVPECDEPEPQADDAADGVVSDSMASGDDLRKWFTINDRYRFRRELFGNDNIAMTDTINMISAMGSLPEVEDYVYSDLEWDRENEEVKAFMDIVAFRFSKRY